MVDLQRLKELDELIAQIETAARGLIDKAQGIQAVERNATRILASVQMLKINVSQVREVLS